MTPDQRAELLANALDSAGLAPSSAQDRPAMIALIADAIKQAVAEERERRASHLVAAARAAEQNGVAVNDSGLRHLASTLRGRTP